MDEYTQSKLSLFTDEQNHALEAILRRYPVFLFGPGGSGKNTVVNEAVNFLEANGFRTARCSFSGAGTLPINGTTLHSFFKLPMKLIDGCIMAEPDIEELMKVDVLIVNYIHSCTPPLIDIIWRGIQLAKNHGHYVQVIFTGDPFSLGSFLDFDQEQQYQKLSGKRMSSWSPLLSEHWDDFGFTNIQLTKDFRHGDTPFALSLEELRMGDPRGINRLIPLLASAPIKKALWICSGRKQAKKKNQDELMALPGEPINLDAIRNKPVRQEDFSVPLELTLKVNAPIMMVANVPSKGLKSGMIGKVVSLNEEQVYVSFPKKKGRFRIERMRFESGNGDIIYQFPLDIAFAITAYKARYLFLEEANIDSSFSNYGLLYGVLSRIADSRKVYIRNFLTKKDVSIDPYVFRWYRNCITGALSKPSSILPVSAPLSYGSYKGMRFGLMEYHPTPDIHRTLICIRGECNGPVIMPTMLTNYIKPVHNKRDVHIDIGDSGYFVTMFLNYAFIDGPCKVTSIEGITPEVIKGFFNAYGMGAYGKGEALHTKQTIDKCVQTVFRFLEEILKDPDLHPSFSLSDLFVTKDAWSINRGVYETKEEAFEIIYDAEEHVTLRDMPPEVVQAMVSIAYERYPDILMNIALGLCAGLRPSETCALSMDQVKVKWRGKKIINVYIDLKHTASLRDDNVKIGNVKKPRIVSMEHIFLDLFTPLYMRYMEYRKSCTADPRFNALCLDSRGNAMSYDTLLRRFKLLVDETVESLCQSKDVRTQSFIEDYRRLGCSCHILRHIFTVNLVMAGYNESDIMIARGDKSVMSAQHYLRNKGYIINRTNANITQLIQWILEASKKYSRGETKGEKGERH